MNTVEQTYQQELELRYRSAEEAFEDWLELSHISAVRRGVPAGGYLPAEFVTKASTPVTIYHEAEHQAHAITVLAEKDAYGIVRAIKVRCSCGCSATIAIDYGEQPLSQPNVHSSGS
ncbi:MAG: hypothetical protein KatS3mg039_1732 [Candidatus Kapaibacterium sp.]|nr:MAG: hypothetical protein KatS3mg039_1732 [Candidatus Kapabacteria bacterium]GIV55308.1 MAG: hypothetical protein KatS3mg040_0076 [Candidatus Kapabacteria bacterium]